MGLPAEWYLLWGGLQPRLLLPDPAVCTGQRGPVFQAPGGGDSRWEHSWLWEPHCLWPPEPTPGMCWTRPQRGRAVRLEQVGPGGLVAVTLSFLGAGVSRGVLAARVGLSLCSRKRPELPRVPATPRITTFPPVPVTCDAVRNKCREMLTAALQTDRECLGSWLLTQASIPRWPGPHLLAGA